MSSETKNLSDFIDKVAKDSHLRVENDLGDGFVLLRSTEAQKRQAKQDIRCCEDIVLELLRNSRDAGAKKIFIATCKRKNKRFISCIDDGCGIPKRFYKKIFDARVTSKLESSHKDKWGFHGRGMALYSIKYRSELAKVTYSQEKLGTAIHVEINNDKLGEKSDQSTFPKFIKHENSIHLRGPLNISRIATEFFLEYANDVEIYLGSPSEIATTLYSYGISALSPVQKAFPDTNSKSPLKILATSHSDKDLAFKAMLLGLDLSNRTARRIINGEFTPLKSLCEIIKMQLSREKSIDKKKFVSKSIQTNVPAKFKLDKQDIISMNTAIKTELINIAQKYGISTDVPVKIHANRKKIIISIPIIEINH